MTGRSISHYRVLEEISRGGMGIVYRAVDLKLDREVALKVLPAELVSDQERKRRFIQEAKAAAALHHPHIATVFEIDEVDGVTFIAMELIEGKKLSDVLKAERLSVARAVGLATEIAEGLVRAHDKGIVHRDLKPANIMVTDDGHAKIIDFGLAKLVEPLGVVSSESETTPRGETDSGRVMGTVAYMSPEQARGQKVDHRTDVFTFGIVLHEMLTGQSLFHRESGADTLSAILKEPAPALPPVELPDEVVAKLQRVIHTCLAKAATQRYRTAKELLAELRPLKEELSQSRATAGTRKAALRRTVRSWQAVGAAALLIVLLLSAREWLRPRQGKAGLEVPRLTNPVQVTAAFGVEDYATWSPDGRTLAYASTQTGDLYGGNWDIFVAQLGAGQPVNRTADHAGADRFPSWSPDGTQIAFWSNRDGGGYFVMSALGGPPRKVTAGGLLIQPSPPQWSSDGSELACVVKDASGVFVEIVSVRTGSSRRVSLPGRKTERFDLAWSPDDRFFAYVDATDLNNDVTQLWALRSTDGAGIPVTDGWANDWSPSWSRDGRILYFVSNRGGSMDLWEQTVDGDGKPVGDPGRLTTGVVMRHAVFSPDGTKLAYSQGRRVANLWRAPLLRDRRANWTDARQLTFDQAYIEYTDVSPDGQRLVVSSDRSGNPDLWMLPAEGGEMMQVTNEPAPDWAPRFSPSGREVVFYSYRTGNRDIWIQPVPRGPARQVTNHVAEDQVPTWSADGRAIAFSSNRSGNLDIWVVSAEGGEARQMTTSPASDHYPHWSPDGKWIVFLSNRTGESRLWRIPATGGDAEPVMETDALYPRWSRDAKAVLFTGTGDTSGNIWTFSLEDRLLRPLTDLSGRKGSPGNYNLTADDRYVYFTWEENLGDLWVMDVASADRQ